MFTFEQHFGLLMQIMYGTDKVTVADDQDGQGPFISQWLVAGVDQPASPRDFFEVNKQVLVDNLTKQLLDEANRRVAAYNWAMFPDIDLDTADLNKVKAYRKALREISLQESFPEQVEWPVDPDVR